MHAIGDTYLNQCRRIMEEISQNVVRKEYSVGGVQMHRGYYCPNPIMDIITTNVNRGRLLKKLTVRSKPSYEYGFNSDNQLLTIRRPQDTEFIIREREGVELGILFDEKHPEYPDVKGISECIYNQGKIQTYIYQVYHYYSPQFDIYRRIEYTYSEEGLSEAEWYEHGARGYTSHNKYFFKHDEEGYLTHMRGEEYGEFFGKVSEPRIGDKFFEVAIKRKI